MVCNPPQLKCKDAHQTAPAPHTITPGSDVTISPTSSTWIQRASLHPFISIASPQPGRYTAEAGRQTIIALLIFAQWGVLNFFQQRQPTYTLGHQHPGALLRDQQT